jgi:hypothetical protein
MVNIGDLPDDVESIQGAPTFDEMEFRLPATSGDRT